MPIRTVSKDVTVCEVFRLINDRCQSEKDKEIRELCVLGVIIGKLISQTKEKVELIELVEQYGTNIDAIKLFNERLNPEYKHEWKRRKEIKAKWGMK